MSPKKIYFASDFHLGVPNKTVSNEREKHIIAWLDTIKADAEALYLVGDLFDFWFEYKHVVPKGYVRLLGKLAELKDAGLPIYCFTGNHDLWMFGYFEEELGIPVYKEPIRVSLKGKQFLIGITDLGRHIGSIILLVIFHGRRCIILRTGCLIIGMG